MDSEEEERPLLRIQDRDEEGNYVIESGSLEFRVKRVHFERQQHFRLEDHLFQLDLVSRSRRPPELLSILTHLKTGVAALIEELQALYSRDDKHQIYITFDDDKFTHGGLNTGNYSLHSNKENVSDSDYADATANDALNMLGNLLRSYDRLKLDGSFHLFFRVLSVPHMQAKRDAQKLKDPRSVQVGAYNLSEMSPNQKRLLHLSSRNIIRFPSSVTSLEDACLLLSFAIGLLHKRHLAHKFFKGQYRAESAIYLKIAHIVNKKKKIFQEGCCFT